MPRQVRAAWILAAALASTAALAQTPVATLTGVQGNVLVSQRDGMAAAASGQALAPGVRIITTAGARATVVYEKACNVALGPNRRYTVREQADCAQAQAPPLGEAEKYAVLAGPRVINVGASDIRGELGTFPGDVVKGFPPGKVNGAGDNGSDDASKDGRSGTNKSIHHGDDSAKQAQQDATKAYENLVGQRCNYKLTGQDLGGLILTPGVYCFAGAAPLTGELWLDAEGDPNAVFVFQVGAALTTAPKSRVRVLNTSDEYDETKRSGTEKEQERKESALCHVYWQVARTAALGKESRFLGNIVAVGDIAMDNSATMVGRALARSGAVALDTNVVDRLACLPPPFWLTPLGAATGVGAAAAVGAGIYEITKSKSPN